MITAMTSRLRFALFAMLAFSILLPLNAYSQEAGQAKTPDFTGVWRTVNPPAAPREGTTLRWLPAPGELPPFTPEYKAKYDKVQISRESGSEETEPVARCLPPGMPWFMLAQYGLEILQTPKKIGFFSEWMDAYRRVYMDGRKPGKDVDPSYNGYSMGHWEGDTLVVETVMLRDDSTLDRYGSPHSDAMTISERMRLTSPDMIENKITVNDPKAFTKPWEYTRTYRRAGPGNDELHENTCAESLKLAQ